MPSPQQHVIKLDPEIGRHLKAWCALHQCSMRDAVAKLVREHLIRERLQTGTADLFGLAGVRDQQR
jgi:hypothetical protein